MPRNNVADNLNPPDIGRRLLIWGNSCAGKSTLAARLAHRLDLKYVDLDALNWLPDWVGLNDIDPERLEQRMQEATTGDAWVVAGSYTRHSQRTFWPRLDTIIWLDLPLRLLLYRVVTRSWRRWRTNELLWGTNYEQFWLQLMFWKKEESLVWWILHIHKQRRLQTLEYMRDPQWAHIQWIRIGSQNELEQWIENLSATGPK